MVPSVAHTVEALTNAYELWQAVATTYSYKGNNMHTHKIQRELRGLTQGSRSITEYVGELKRLWNDFDFYSPFTPTHPDDVDVFHKWIERQHLVDFLDELNPEFEYRCSSILSTQEWPTLDEAISLVLSKETRLATMSSSTNTAIRSALVIQPTTLGSSSPINSTQETQPRPHGVKICDHCHKPGHIKAYCYELYGRPTRGRGRGGGRSGRGRVRLADSSFTSISGKGSIKCTSELPLSSVLHEPKTGRKLGTGIMHNGLYYLEGGVSRGYSKTSLTVSSSQKEDLLLQHRRLGHLPFTLLARMFPTIFESYNKEKLVCDACELAKHTRSAYPGSGLHSKAMFEVVHSDVWRPYGTTTISDHRWYLAVFVLFGIIDLRLASLTLVPSSAFLLVIPLLKKGTNIWCPNERKLFISMDVIFRESEPFYISSVSSSSPVTSETGREGEFFGGSPITVDVGTNGGYDTQREFITNGGSDTQGEFISINASSDTQEEASKTASETLSQPATSISSDSSPLSEPIMHSPVSRSSSPVLTVSSSTMNGNSPVPPIHFTLDNDDLNVPIALRKPTRHAGISGRLKDGVGYKHDITNFVSYESLSPSYQSFIASLSSVSIPKNWKVAKEDPKWKAAMLEEMRALKKNNTWELVSLPAGKQTVGCKWIFTVKQTPEGTVERYKARLLDVKKAFLHGELQEEVYMDIPPEFATAQIVGKVCQLRRSLYDLKQSPRAWFDRFRRAIIQMGYKQSNADHTLFFRHNKGKIAVLIVYVDDIVVTGDDSEEIAHLKAQLAQAFEARNARIFENESTNPNALMRQLLVMRVLQQHLLSRIIKAISSKQLVANCPLIHAICRIGKCLYGISLLGKLPRNLGGFLISSEGPTRLLIDWLWDTFLEPMLLELLITGRFKCSDLSLMAVQIHFNRTDGNTQLIICWFTQRVATKLFLLPSSDALPVLGLILMCMT
ncbi:uncharacterized protein [Elaeis guineensis]|uniref:uncharacterized protein n=1 Tax=Elaeis guineensis var. tenera TaxID=51953 RepID=UPI003C6D0BEA